jgi:hypothetical protein
MKNAIVNIANAVKQHGVASANQIKSYQKLTY